MTQIDMKGFLRNMASQYEQNVLVAHNDIIVRKLLIIHQTIMHKLIYFISLSGRLGIIYYIISSMYAH